MEGGPAGAACPHSSLPPKTRSQPETLGRLLLAACASLLPIAACAARSRPATPRPRSNGGRWGAVCESGFEQEAAAIACAQLGYVRAAAPRPKRRAFVPGATRGCRSLSVPAPWAVLPCLYTQRNASFNFFKGFFFKKIWPSPQTDPHPGLPPKPAYALTGIRAAVLQLHAHLRARLSRRVALHGRRGRARRL